MNMRTASECCRHLAGRPIGGKHCRQDAGSTLAVPSHRSDRRGFMVPTHAKNERRLPMNLPEHFLVTGGAGFIGSYLVERLLAEGKAVTVIDDLSTGNLDNLQAVISNPNLRVIESKVSECRALSEIVAESESIY